MAKVFIGNAVHDENGKAKGGQPGDQTGKEVVVQAWYKNSKGWRVLRPKDGTVARKIAEAMRNACANNAIGYDQGDRNTLYTEAAKIGFDPGRVSVPCETDCSALVRVCLAYAGIKVPNFNTANEAAVLMATDKFTELTGKEYTDASDRLREGDVLITKVKGHTAVILNNGPKADDDPVPPAPEPEPPAPTPGTKMIKVKGSVRVRDGNGKNHAQIKPTVSKRTNPSGLIPYNGQATESPYWYMTEWQGQQGYITSQKRYTEVVEV